LNKDTSQHLVCMTSYHAATAYINHTCFPNNDSIILGSQLSVFKEYFSKQNESHIIEENWNNKDYWAFLDYLKPKRITYWGYALSDIALLTVHFARKKNITIEIIMPSETSDKLYGCKDLDIRVLIKNWKSMPKMILQILKGWPIKIKTFDNYLYDCIDTRLVQSVKTYKEIVSSPNFSTTNYIPFAKHIQKIYPNVLKELKKNTKTCIILDENFEMWEKLNGKSFSKLKNIYSRAIEMLNTKGYSVCLKPTYYNEPNLSKHFHFTSIIPGVIPIQALDILLTKGTLVTGGSLTFMKEKVVNLNPIKICNLEIFLRNIDMPKKIKAQE